MTHTETATAASAGQTHISRPARLTHAQTVDVTMTIEGMQRLTDDQIYSTVYQFMKQRPGVDADQLQAFGNRICRLADEKERG